MDLSIGITCRENKQPTRFSRYGFCNALIPGFVHANWYFIPREYFEPRSDDYHFCHGLRDRSVGHYRIPPKRRPWFDPFSSSIYEDVARVSSMLSVAICSFRPVGPKPSLCIRHPDLFQLQVHVTSPTMSNNTNEMPQGNDDKTSPPDLATYQKRWQEIHQDTVRKIDKINSNGPESSLSRRG